MSYSLVPLADPSSWDCFRACLVGDTASCKPIRLPKNAASDVRAIELFLTPKWTGRYVQRRRRTATKCALAPVLVLFV